MHHLDSDRPALEVTDEMVEAGHAVVDLYGPDGPARRADWLALAFLAMARRQVGLPDFYRDERSRVSEHLRVAV